MRSKTRGGGLARSLGFLPTALEDPTIKMIVGLLQPDKGTITVNGFETAPFLEAKRSIDLYRITPISTRRSRV